MPVRSAKRILARAARLSGVLRGAELAQVARHGQAYIRVVNMHGTPARLAGQLRRQVAYMRGRYEPVTEQDLGTFLKTGTWPRKKPGLILSFDDALRSNITTALPIVEEHDLVAWMFVPIAFVDTPPREQIAFANVHRITVDEEFADGRVAASWDELRAATVRHVVGCHTLTHRRLGPPVDRQVLDSEVIDSKRQLEQRLGRPVNAFCWVGGEEHSYSREGAVAVAEAGYQFSFMTNNAPITARTSPLQLQRTNIEADWGLDVVRFQLSGLMDILYAGKRTRVNRLTMTSPTPHFS